MKFLARLTLIAVLTYIVPFYFPWWTIFPIAFLIGYLIPGNGFNVFNAGFIGGGIIWMGYAFVLDSEVESLLSNKIVQLMSMNDPTYLVILAGLIAALSCGFAALTGTSFRQIFIKKKKTGLYS